jgi:Flp pilus assembly protein TadD
VRGLGGVSKAFALACACASLTACADHETDLLTASLTGTSIPPSATLVQQAQKQFSEGHYGSAVDAFAKTIEKDPLNADAWLGAAASYDQVGRFDEADKAYTKVQELIGATPSVLNNLGYSYLLRGNLDRSRTTLEAAYRGDPQNPYIRNNIEILNQRLVSLGHPPLALN